METHPIRVLQANLGKWGMVKQCHGEMYIVWNRGGGGGVIGKI